MLILAIQLSSWSLRTGLARLCLAMGVGLLLILAAPFATHSQDDTTAIKVVHVSPRPQTDRMALDVFFNIVDADGRPRPDLSLSAADIVLLSAEGIATAPVQATVRDPQTPIYVALLIDTSGSMVNAMPAVREAAKAMVDEAPSNMFISVIPFSELPETGPLTPLSSFSRDHGLVKRDIDLVEAIPNSPTCLYNAAYNAIELLEGQEPNEEERRAIILFTDGRDEVVNGQPCSRRTEDDVIARATVNRNNLTPIFTIGLREGENPRIDEALLRRLAVETNAYYAIGDRNGVSNLFREIMGYLNSQWVAHADVFPHQGINQAEIRVDIGSGIPLRETFNFLSEADHSPKAEEPVAIEPRPPVFQNGTYQLPLSIANPQGIFRLEATVTLGGRVVRNIVVQVDGNPNPIVEWPAGEDFRAGDYRVEVRGQDFNGDQICELKDDKRNCVLAEVEFSHETAPPPPPIKVTVLGARAAFTQSQLIVRLDISDPARVDDYSVIVTDQAGGVEESTPANFFLPAPGQPLQVTVPLPSLISKITVPQDFKVSVRVWNKQREPQDVSEPLPITATPPPPPTTWEIIKRELQENTLLQGILVLLFMGGTVWFIWPSKRGREPEAPPPLPIENTQIAIAGIAVDPPVSIRVRLLRAPNQLQEVNALVTELPCVIGRGDHCGVSLGKATSDKRVSREHAKLEKKDTELYLTDLGTVNGTYIDGKKLQQHKPTRLGKVSQVRLGPETTIEIETEL